MQSCLTSLPPTCSGKARTPGLDPWLTTGSLWMGRVDQTSSSPSTWAVFKLFPWRGSSTLTTQEAEIVPPKSSGILGDNQYNMTPSDCWALNLRRDPTHNCCSHPFLTVGNRIPSLLWHSALLRLSWDLSGSRSSIFGESEVDYNSLRWQEEVNNTHTTCHHNLSLQCFSLTKWVTLNSNWIIRLIRSNHISQTTQTTQTTQTIQTTHTIQDILDHSDHLDHLNHTDH